MQDEHTEKESNDVVEENESAEADQAPETAEADQNQGADADQAEDVVAQPAQFSQLSDPGQIEGEGNLDLLLDVKVKVTAELGRTTMLIRDILSLGHGSIIELNKLAGEPVDLMVNNKQVAKGEVVVIEEAFGIRVTEILDPKQRIQNLG